MLKNLSVKTSIVASLATTLFLLSSCLSPEQKIDRALLKIQKDFDNVGIGAAVVKNNEIVYTGSVGYRDLEEQIPLSDNDIFRIASISKSFTATSLLQLVDKGIISLDDDISSLIGFTVRNPYFPDKVITLKMILSHTSSLNDNAGYFSLDVINPAVSGDCRESFNNYEPGSAYEYCNLGYNLSGSILEKISGERFDNYVRNHVIRPLGLYGGHNVDSLDHNLFAYIYEWEDSLGRYVRSDDAYKSRADMMPDYRIGYSAPIFSPTGGVKISAGDLAKYMIMHINYGEANGVRIISEESSRIMQSDIWKGEKSSYGLAICSFNGMIDGYILRGHTGGAYGLNSIMIFNPEEKWGITIITNGIHYSEKMKDKQFLLEATRAIYKAAF